MSARIHAFIELVALALCFASIAWAQGDCPALVSAALEAANAQCADTARNQVCYGNVRLSATPFENVADFRFEQSGDIASIGDIQRLELSSMSLVDETWGVALMRVQANLPDTLPGQNVTFLLFGDVQIDNAVEKVVEAPFTATGNVNVRLRPTTTADNVIASLARGQEVIATGRLADGSWVRIRVEGDARGVGWVAADFLQGEAGSLDALTVIEPGAPQFGPMQAFYFRTGIGDRSCAESPDSGILVQTPEGARRVELQVNGVDITLGSTAYLQAGGGFMTVSVVEGQATLEAQGVSQFVPAGSAARVPLDASGAVAGPPEVPQPYDYESLRVLPVTVALPKSVEVAPALTEAELEQKIEAEQSSAPVALPAGRPIVAVDPYNGGSCAPVLVAPAGQGSIPVAACVPFGTIGVVTGDPVQEGISIRYPVTFENGATGWLLEIYIQFQ